MSCVIDTNREQTWWRFTGIIIQYVSNEEIKLPHKSRAQKKTLKKESKKRIEYEESTNWKIGKQNWWIHWELSPAGWTIIIICNWHIHYIPQFTLVEYVRFGNLILLNVCGHCALHTMCTIWSAKYTCNIFLFAGAKCVIVFQMCFYQNLFVCMTNPCLRGDAVECLATIVRIYI